MKSILLSIKPKYVELIAKGEKTVEVRKTKPNLETPFKCYIYCTKGKTELPIERKINRELEDMCDGYEILYWANGKVIGEFTCDKIEEYTTWLEDYHEYEIDDDTLPLTCLTRKQLYDYGQGKTLYGWHISDLKIYDEPKELSEFVRKCEIPNGDIGCKGCEYFVNYKGYEYDESDCGCDGIRPLKRPPQSWGYVEYIFFGKKVKGRNWY